MTAYDVGGTNVSIDHDDNGNRDPQGSRDYEYDKDDRLIKITDGANELDFHYDYTGWRVARIENGAVTRYYNRAFEATDAGWITKRYFAGGRLIAQRREWSPQFAAGGSAFSVAAASIERPAVVVLVREDLHIGVALGLALLSTGLVVAPWRRKRVVGVRVRHGHALLIAVGFSVATLPWPLLLRPEAAWAQCSGTPTPTPGPETVHFHLDHLGSVHAITSTGPLTGTVLRYNRYLPYGEIRGRFDPTGSGVGFDDRYRYEFTGYETEPITGVQYAGARFYDPVTGQFLTHDPAREFASPYTYVGWDPVNGTDPNGECELICLFLIGFAIGFAVSAIQAGANGASVGQALKAGAIGGAIGGVTGVGLGIVGGAVAGNPTLNLAYHLALTGSGAYSTVQSFQSGQFIAGAAGAVALAYGLSGLYESADNFGQGGNRISATEAKDLTIKDRDAVVKAAEAEGYVPSRHGHKLEHSSTGYFGTKRFAQFIFGTSEGILGYTGRLLATPFVTAIGIGYELHAAFNPFYGEGYANFFDYGQSLPDWLFDTSLDLVANTYGQLVALTPGLSGSQAITALRFSLYIPGPNQTVLGRALYKPNPPNIGVY